MLGGPRVQLGDVETQRVEQAAGDVGDRDHRRALVVQLRRRDAADVAEALHDAALLVEPVPEPVARALRRHHDTGSRGLAPEDRAADRDRLPGHDLRHRMADEHRVRVHHPGHRLLVRRHVGRGDVGLRPDLAHELRREAARQLLDLARRERARVAANAALRAAVRAAAASAHFHVIHDASAAHSPSDTSES